MCRGLKEILDTGIYIMCVIGVTIIIWPTSRWMFSFYTVYDIDTFGFAGWGFRGFNCSLREGKLPNEWKMANIIPLPKSNPPASIHKDIRPISLTPIAAKVFESIVMDWVDDTIVSNVDPKQFGGLAGTSTTDALVEMTHKWYEATDTRNTYVGPTHCPA